MTHEHDQGYTRRRNVDTFLTRVPPDRWEESDGNDFPISFEEWKGIVADDPDIESNGASGYRLISHPQGTPLIYEDGWVMIREEDSATVEKLVAIAAALDAFVIDENGQVFESVEGEQSAGAAHEPVTRRDVIIPIEEERLRQRQMWLLVALLSAYPIGALVFFVPSELHPLAIVAGVACVALAIWTAVRMRTPRFYLQQDIEGRLIVYRENTKSSDDTATRVDLDRDEIPGIELVWHPLKYASQTRIEFQVRAQRHPWLVLMSESDETKARDAMNRIASDLGLTARDSADGGPAKDVPKKYQLTKQEMRTSPGTSWTVVAILAAGAIACFLLGGTPRFMVAGALLGLVALGVVIKPSPQKAQEKYRKWLKE